VTGNVRYRAVGRAARADCWPCLTVTGDDRPVVALRANARVDAEGRVTRATRWPSSRRPRTQCRLGKRRGFCRALLKGPIGLRHTFAQRHATAVGTVSRLSSGTEPVCWTA
jgi:hypothetical protein